MSLGFDIFPEVTGSLLERPPAALVVLVEQKRITGVLEAHDGPSRFELTLRGGEVTEVETTVDCDDPLERFLDLEKGRYRLRQQLLLPNGEVSDQRVATGSLEDFGPIELVQSCERAGLHGTLRVKCGGRIVEVLFDTGVLTTVTLDGHQDVDVNDVWSWTQGEWAILALPALEPPPDPCDSGMEFLRDFEVAAVSFLSVAAHKAESTWSTGDSVETGVAAPQPEAREVAEGEESDEDVRSAEIGDSDEGDDAATLPDVSERPERRPDERTVRVIYYDTAKPTEDPTPLPSRYADADVTSVFIYKRPKQKIVVENSSCVGPTSRGIIDDVVPLAAMASSKNADKDPIELAFAPALRKSERPRPEPLRIEPRRGDSPWPIVVVTLILLGLIGVILYLVSYFPGGGE